MLEAATPVLVVPTWTQNRWGWSWVQILLYAGQTWSEHEEAMVPEHLSSPFCEFPLLCGLGTMQVTGNWLGRVVDRTPFFTLHSSSLHPPSQPPVATALHGLLDRSASSKGKVHDSWCLLSSSQLLP